MKDARRRPRLRKISVCALAGVAAWLAASFAYAEPYLAIQEGYKCSKCHVNMTGGGKRTDFANIYVQTRLANDFLNWREWMPGADGDDGNEDESMRTDAQSSFFSGRLNDYIAIGGDFRFLFERTDTPDNPTEDRFNQRKQNIYLEVDLIPERVIFYQTLTGGGDAREIFGLLKWNSMYVKAGEFFLPYGLRLLDDSAFTRSVTGFTYGTVDSGVEVGWEPGRWAFNLAATNGTGTSIENNRDKRLTGSLAFVHKGFRVGGSYSTNENAQGVETVIYGLHGGAQFGRVGLLAAADVIDDSADRELVGIFEVNLLMTRGNNLKLSYEYHDPSEEIFENARERYSLVWEPFVNQFTQFRAGIRDYKGIPQNDDQNRTEYFLELHLFL